MVIWMIGLAGSGKTSIGRALYESLKGNNPATVFLDGDHVRQIMGEDLGHTLDHRYRNAWRICQICKFLDDQGIDVVCSILSIFHEHQTWNRQTYSKYFETFIDVSQETLRQRDQKGLYSGAESGEIKNVVGYDIEFVPPANPDLIIKNDADTDDFSNIVHQIIQALPITERAD